MSSRWTLLASASCRHVGSLKKKVTHGKLSKDKRQQQCSIGSFGGASGTDARGEGEDRSLGGGPNGEALVVDVDDDNIAEVASAPIRRQGHLSTYEISGLQTGSTILAARLFSETPTNRAARRQSWLSRPIWAQVEVSVLGSEYSQGDKRWGNITYGSTRQEWKKVKWTNMALSGCGPTSLAIVMDYLIRLDSPERHMPASFSGTDPKQTMAYTSSHGRAADSKGQPSGTSGQVMISDIGAYWPDYEGKTVNSVDNAASLLRAGKPLVFLAKQVTTYRYDKKGVKETHTWPGHFMVLLGVEHDTNTFWISDPSRKAHKYIDRKELAKCQIWQISRKPEPSNP